MKGSRLFLLALYCAQFPLLEAMLRRGDVRPSFATLGSAIAVFQSVCFWLALATFSKRKGARGIIALLSGFAIALQTLFFLRFGGWVGVSVVRAAWADWHDVVPGIMAEATLLVTVTAAASAISFGWLTVACPPTKHRQRWEAAGIFALFLALLPVSTLDNGPPDMRLLSAGAFRLMSSAARESSAGSKGPELEKLPVIKPRIENDLAKNTGPSIPNVVMIITESIRADEYCSNWVEDCKTAPEVNALLPDRVGFPEMRSLGSYTAVSMSVLMTGRPQDVSRDELMRSVTLADVAKAIEPNPPFSAFWSAHHAPVFHWEDPKRGFDSYVTKESFRNEENGHDGDVYLADFIISKLPSLPSPFFLVLHFHDTHILYAFDENDAPFSPWSRKVRWETMPELRNAYRNAIHFQDQQIARVISAFKEDERWPKTFLLFTSDHGESFGEDGHIHHGQTLRDEQTHVPGFVAYGDEVLSDAEDAALRENAKRHLTHLDITKTVLDLFGVLGSYGLARPTRMMQGQSLLEPWKPPPAVTITNCTEEFPCPWNAWGVLKGDTKLEAQGWDYDWNCHSLSNGKEEPLDMKSDRCRELLFESRLRFPKLPNGKDNL